MKQRTPLLVGAHTSISGGVHKALLRGRDIGASTIQMFTSNQRQWQGRPISEEELERWFATREETGITDIMSHASYLINLGSCKAELLEKSRSTFREELTRCHNLELAYLNFHPGAATGATEEACLSTIVESLLDLAPLANKGATRLLLETTAGQGTTVGHRFKQLNYIIDRVQNHLPIGVCIDTCHIFSAGYDIRTQQAWNETLDTFDKTIGLKHLYAFHLNDSKFALDSRKDRHENLGKGAIGIECFKVLMQDQRTKKLPKYLETPNGDLYWSDEITQLKRFGETQL